VGDNLFRHIEVLASFPLIGPVTPVVASHPTCRIVYGDYLIFYRVHREPKVVEILTIWHAARGLPDLL
jgi:plasmid stabilization system protein ParE